MKSDIPEASPAEPYKSIITGNKIRIREKKLSDARNDYNWAKDPDLSHLDAAPKLTIGFSEYLLDFTAEFYYPTMSRQRFAVDTLDGQHIGNCSFYNINFSKGEAELGIMIGDREYWDKAYGVDVVTTMLAYMFGKDKFKRIYLKTLTENFRAQKCFRKCGFLPYGHMSRDGYEFMLMEIYYKAWQMMQETLKEQTKE